MNRLGLFVGLRGLIVAAARAKPHSGSLIIIGQAPRDGSVK